MSVVLGTTAEVTGTLLPARVMVMALNVAGSIVSPGVKLRVIWVGATVSIWPLVMIAP